MLIGLSYHLFSKFAYNLADTFDSEVLGHMCGWFGVPESWARRTALETGSTKADSNAGNDELLAQSSRHYRFWWFRISWC